MDITDFSNIADEIISSRPPSFDLLGQSTRRWPVVYMSPPWLFQHRSEKGNNRQPVSQAGKSVTYDSLATIPMGSLLEKDAVVLMWTPDTQLPQALWLFDQWGLRYNGTMFYWIRTRDNVDLKALDTKRDIPMLTGYITRGNPIPLIMGVQGELGLRRHVHEDKSVRPLKNIRKQQFAPYTKGGAHPSFRELIELLYNGPYLELFGDGKEGWDHWRPNESD